MTQQCRSCGCTNVSTCPGQCFWVEDDLCSRCAVAHDVATGDLLTAAELIERIPDRASPLLPDELIEAAG